MTTEKEAIKPRTDPYIWGSYIALLIVSVIELFSASSQEVQVDDIYGPIIRHGSFLAIGLLVMLGLQRIHFMKLYSWIPIFVIVSMVMMAMVLAVGININGVKRAIRIAGMLVLPAEFLKLAAALGVAWILSLSQIKTPKGTHDVSTGGVVFSAFLVLVCCGLLFNQGLTNTLLLMGISMGMMLVGGVGWKKLGYVLLAYLVIGAGAMLFKYATTHDQGPTEEDYRLAKINQTEVVSTAGKSDRSHTWKARIERHMRLNKSADPITDENKRGTAQLHRPGPRRPHRRGHRQFPRDSPPAPGVFRLHLRHCGGGARSRNSHLRAHILPVPSWAGRGAWRCSTRVHSPRCSPSVAPL